MKFPPCIVPRRKFLQATTGAGLLGLGSADTLLSFGVSDDEALISPDLVQLRPEIKPLVKLLDDTPREKCPEVIVQQLQKGVPYRELMAAAFLLAVTRGGQSFGLLGSCRPPNVAGCGSGRPVAAAVLERRHHQGTFDAIQKNRSAAFVRQVAFFRESSRRVRNCDDHLGSRESRTSDHYAFAKCREPANDGSPLEVCGARLEFHWALADFRCPLPAHVEYDWLATCRTGVAFCDPGSTSLVTIEY